MSRFNRLLRRTELRTMARAMPEEPNRSAPSNCRPRFTSVSVTFFAFLLVIRVMTMTTPEINRKRNGVSTFPRSMSMLNADGSAAPAVTQALKEAYPAMGTPIKLTRSLPAKAMARAKVPASTTTLRMSILKSHHST